MVKVEPGIRSSIVSVWTSTHREQYESSMRNQKMTRPISEPGPISDCVLTEQCIAVTDWPDNFLIFHTRSLWAEVQTDTMEERVSESMVSVWLMPG